jgi:small subunit ribosomal protein S16
LLERELDQPTMLAIRLQRTGRKGLAHYRVIVQEAQKSPKSGRVVARIGHYNPHTKEVVVDKEQAEKFMKNGAQPSDKVARLFKSEKVKLPSWVELDSNKKRSVKNTEKLRKHQPAKEEAKVELEVETADAPSEASTEAPQEVKEVPSEPEVVASDEPANEEKPEAVEPSTEEVKDASSEETGAEKKEEKPKA